MGVDDETGSIRIAAASLSNSLRLVQGTSEANLVSIDFDFAEWKLQDLNKNADGSFVISPLAFDIEVNDQETVLLLT